jgi:hypothetical protein
MDNGEAQLESCEIFRVRFPDSTGKYDSVNSGNMGSLVAEKHFDAGCP